MGACMLLRRAAVDDVGECDEDYFLFSEETDWCYRFREAGWEVVFFPGAECVHVRGAAHSGRLYRENLRGHLLFLSKHRGPKVAERARRLLLAALRDPRRSCFAASAGGRIARARPGSPRGMRRHSSGGGDPPLRQTRVRDRGRARSGLARRARARGPERFGDDRVVARRRVRSARGHLRARLDAEPDLRRSCSRSSRLARVLWARSRRLAARRDRCRPRVGASSGARWSGS